MEGIVALTRDTFEAAAGRGAALVEFYSPQCGHCRMQAPVMEEAAAGLAGRATVGQINADAEGELAERFNVGVVPTHIFLQDGEEKGRPVGVQKAETLISGIEELF